MQHRKRALVVEDEAELLFVWAMALNKIPEVEVVTAENGEVAFERFRAAPFDLVITDLSMPAMDGLELTRAIRQLDPEVPIIWVTAHEHFRERMEENGLNVQAFLPKPVSVQQIREVVRYALEL
ncbi:MAG TPA: response regulator [Anaerolineae bacterium]|nr:response regulator [Anaerolineae bacterium]